MEYPEELQLSPGMSATLVVIFKPGQNPVYSDKIVFSTAKGAFAVRLEGRHPNAELVMPPQLDFGFCPVKESTPQSFPVRLPRFPSSFFALGISNAACWG